MTRRVPLALTSLATAVVLLAAGCASAQPPASAGDDLAVPDAFTAVTVAPIGQPPLPFRGTDGLYHVVYDLQLTNATAIPATVASIEVVDAAAPTSVLARFADTQLVDTECAVGDCNRLRGLPASYLQDAVIPPQQSRVAFIDFTVESPDDLPPTLLHRISGTAAASPAFGEPAAVSYLTTPVPISTRDVPVIAAPVAGDDWVALNGCCEPGFPHRSSVMSVNGKLNNSQRFAIDWKRTDPSGAFYSGDKTKNESYADYGSHILAVGDGTVVSVLDGMAANAPGTLPAHDPTLAAKLTVENVDGNHIVIDLGDGVYAMYAHLIAGSLKVKPGDTVKEGQVIAELGNTGNANASHLHFQLMDGPSLLEADSLPYELQAFDYAGQVAPELISDADDYLSGTFLQAKLTTPEPRKKELPLNLAIIDFG